jgi:sulfonate transport system substrate-binding protein
MRKYRMWGALLALVCCSVAAEERLTELRLDYAYYSPASLVAKRFGWVESVVAAEGTRVRWVFSQGSNRALEYLNGGSVDFASTAGLAALLARANGNPVRTVYVYSRAEWTALAVPKDSPIRSVSDLKGRKVAATKGTDPYLFLLRSLRAFNVLRSEVEIVHLQHPDGRVALEQGRVDAWAGLDPHLAASELEAGSRLLYRNTAFNSFGVLNTSDAFLAVHPKVVERVIAVYERARRWIIEHPAETVRILAEESKLPLAVARRQLERTDLSVSAPGMALAETLREAGPILEAEGLVRKGTDIPAVVNALIVPTPARLVTAKRD